MVEQLIVMQQVIQLSFRELLMIPAFLLAGIYGWRRGWREEAITTVGLVVSLLMFSNENIATNIASLINRVVAAFGVFLNALLGGETTSFNPLITADNFDTFRMVAFAVATVTSYIIGTAIGKRSETPRTGHFFGILVGMFNIYLVLSKAYDFWLERRQAGQNMPFDDGAQIIVTPMPTDNGLRANLPTIFTLLFLIVLVVTFFRLPRMRE